MNDTVAVHSTGTNGVTYTPGETYYRNRTSGVIFGKSIVQGSYLNPELEELVAVDAQKLVPVGKVKASVSNEVLGSDEYSQMLKRRQPIRSVPRYDAKESELDYKHNPIQAQAAINIRDPDGVLAAEAAEQARLHAEQTLESTEAQQKALEEKRKADLQAQADYEHGQRVLAQRSSTLNGRQTQMQTADLATQLTSPPVPPQQEPPAVQQAGSSEIPQSPAPVDLSGLT